ncbi:MAG: MBL fold metallo-hydrolase [Cohaesibacter sp.]|jgi:L-ascorbate metabolism protein UlaG (beta-lactamase superfamily)|nr:MBL fold metallo-hydrolase [Cohaesibacter sp.]
MLDRTRPSHHRADGRFQNPPGSPKGTATFRDFLAFMYQQLFKTKAPDIPSGHVLSKEDTKQQLAQASNPGITWLGHASFLIRTGGKVILTDPYLQETAGIMGIGPKRFVPAALSVEELPQVDVLLLSHNHYDHLDTSVIEAYPYKSETEVIVPLGLAPFFTKRGYSKVTELDWWQGWELDGVTIKALPAIHFSGRGLFDRTKTLWASYAIETNDGKIWFSGDTARGEIFKEVGEKEGPFDVAIVGIGAYEPRSIMEEVHATPEEAIGIAKAVRAQKAIGMHWGTIMLTPEDPFEAPPRFRQAAIDQDFGEENAIIMSIGETRDL